MALINCPECGNQVSSSAPNCTTCGYDFVAARRQAKRKRDKIFGALLLLIALAVLYVTWAHTPLPPNQMPAGPGATNSHQTRR